MAATAARAGARNGSGASTPTPPQLPPLSVARFHEAMLLVERLVAEKTSVFIAAGQAYRDEHREATSRPLNAVEVTQIAGGLSSSLADAKQQIEEAGIEHHDEPDPQELLIAAGLSTAPAFMDAALRLTALIELPRDAFVEAREAGTLDEAIAAHVKEHFDDPDLDLKEGRARASRALAHMSEYSGVEPGKAWELVLRVVTQGLGQALAHLTSYAQASSPSPSSTDSAGTTTGHDGRSSTTSPGGTPGS